MVAIRYPIWPFAYILLLHILYSLHTGNFTAEEEKEQKDKKMLLDMRWVMSGECIKIKISGRDAP